MPNYRITSTNNPIIASKAFMELNHPDDYTLEEEAPAAPIRTFSPSELLDAFTTEEAMKAETNTNPAVVAQMSLLGKKRNVIIEVDDEGYQNAIQLLESEGILTTERAAEFKAGLPI